MGLKQYLDVDVLTAAEQRIETVFDRFDRICVSFSAGKDSTVMLHLAMAEAKRRDRKIAVLIIDLEAQYTATMAHAEALFAMYAQWIDPYWIALPLSLRNAVSTYQPQWLCWDPDARASWVREPPAFAIVDEHHFPFFRRGMEFEDLVPAFGEWYSQGKLTACLVGIRTDESLNRFRAIMGDTANIDGHRWTTWKGGSVYNAYPIYDWRVDDIWTYHARTGLPYNPIYDAMHRAGLTPHQMRICQPYGDDQRKGLWLYHVIEPATWPRVVARVHGANAGALYSRESGSILGVHHVTLPSGHTWKTYAEMLLDSLPPHANEHYANKIAAFLNWHSQRGYQTAIPDEADPKAEAAKETPSWRRICRVILRNDWWCKGLSFSPHKGATSYDRYKTIMKKRRAKWGY